MDEQVEKSRRGGAPSKYDESADKAIDLIRSGLSYKDAARGAGISYSTFLRWRNAYPDFSDKINAASQAFQEEVVEILEGALYRTAMGYTVSDVKTEYSVGVDGEKRIVKQIEIKKEIAPSVPAIIFALSNLHPDKWKNRYREEVFTMDGRKITFGLSSVVDDDVDILQKNADNTKASKEQEAK
nr:MAG TPA: terminase small subunit [Caudoviricetes sp.]